ncbi:hypothetical protein COP2_044538 [Malus domestica]
MYFSKVLVSQSHQTIRWPHQTALWNLRRAFLSRGRSQCTEPLTKTFLGHGVALTENRATSKRNSRRSWKRTKNPPGSPG